MEMSLAHRRKTGAFYTPPVWGDLAVTYLWNWVQDPSEWIFYDPFAGEGVLLEALRNYYGTRTLFLELYGTTLEDADVAILRSKGFNAYAYDFFDDSLRLEDLPFWERIASGDKRLCIFTNPPYFVLGAEQYTALKERIGERTSCTQCLAWWRMLVDICPDLICAFNSAGFIQTKSKCFSRNAGIYAPCEVFCKGFVTCSKQGWGLSGLYPIMFSVFDPTNYGPYDDVLTYDAYLPPGYLERSERGVVSETNLERLERVRLPFHCYG